MGYSVGIFVDEVDDNLLCSICSQVLQDAVLTPCGHSFCQQCLDQWLVRPERVTCPHCRGAVIKEQARPILSMRNFVLSLRIHCVNRSLGCDAAVTLDTSSSHVETCGHSIVQCAGCQCTLKRVQLPDHQTRCRVIAALIQDDEDTLEPPRPDSPKDTMLCDLSGRVSTLEAHIQQMKADLYLADQRNQQLGHDLATARQELEERRLENLQRHSSYTWDTTFNYGYTVDSIVKLTSLLLRHRQHLPGNVDANKVFDCVRRCYDNFGHNRKSGARDLVDAVEQEEDSRERDEVHMLVATAQACSWFTDTQKVNLHCWLQSIARHRQFYYIQQYG